MSLYSRRDFLKQLSLASAVFLNNGITFSQNSDFFELLVLGDSLMWGQGLLEEQKTYTLVKKWIQNEITATNQTVNLKVKAHSGATIVLHNPKFNSKETSDFSRLSVSNPEVTVPFPTLNSQSILAKREYESEGKSADAVKLVFLSCGIVDLTVAGILNPFGKNKTLRKNIVRCCNEEMFKFLETAAVMFPNAIFAVVGYFPILSNKTPNGKMLNDMLESFSFPRPLKPLGNNVLTRNIFKPLKNKSLKRSRIWFAESNIEFQKAVNRLNEKLGKQRAIFIKSPISEENALETPNTLLFTMDKSGKTNDAYYEQRSLDCKKEFTQLKREVGYKGSVRHCEIASIGHPNPAGAKAYAESIKESLNQMFAR
jgi:lysophospholipase L1-like esterase